MLPVLLDQIPGNQSIGKVSADGAYDSLIDKDDEVPF